MSVCVVCASTATRTEHGPSCRRAMLLPTAYDAKGPYRTSSSRGRAREGEGSKARTRLWLCRVRVLHVAALLLCCRWRQSPQACQWAVWCGCGIRLHRGAADGSITDRLARWAVCFMRVAAVWPHTLQAVPVRWAVGVGEMRQCGCIFAQWQLGGGRACIPLLKSAKTDSCRWAA